MHRTNNAFQVGRRVSRSDFLPRRSSCLIYKATSLTASFSPCFPAGSVEAFLPPCHSSAAALAAARATKAFLLALAPAQNPSLRSHFLDSLLHSILHPAANFGGSAYSAPVLDLLAVYSPPHFSFLVTVYFVASNHTYSNLVSSTTDWTGLDRWTVAADSEVEAPAHCG